MARRAPTTTYRRIAVEVRDAEEAERIAAEAYASGAVGLEERERSDGITLELYVPDAAADDVVDVVRQLASGSVGEAQRVPETNWAERWRASHVPIEVSPRLIVRPSFADVALGPEQHELVIDPGQAFGTGGHASTRLALEWIDALAPALKPESSVLDVGAGTGVLALAALRFGAARAVALDLDPLATEAAQVNARRNGLADRLDVLCGPLEATAPERFPLVVANMLRSELLPLLAGIARRVAPDGHAVFSGLLESESADFERALDREGLRVTGTRHRDDDNGDCWVALLTTR